MKMIFWLPVTMTVVFTASCTSIQPKKDVSSADHTGIPPKDGQLVEEKVTKKNVENPSPVTELPIERVFELQQSGVIFLIDTRPTIFYNLGHIDGAHSLPLKSFDKSFSKNQSAIDAALAEGKKLVIYCQSEKCTDSNKMAKVMSEMGYKVSVFKGGWELWKMSGL